MWTGVSTQIFTKPLLGEMKSSVRREWGSCPEFHSYSIVPAPHMLGESGLGGCDSGFPGLSHVLDKHLFLLNLSEGCSIRVNETLMTRYAYEQHIREKSAGLLVGKLFAVKEFTVSKNISLPCFQGEGRN